MKLVREILRYMYSKVADLYFAFNIDALGWILSEAEAMRGLLMQATELVRIASMIKELSLIINKLRIVILQSFREIITARKRIYEESYEIRGVLISSLSVQNYAKLRPPVQEVITRTLITPENLLMAWLVYDLDRETSKLMDLLSKLISSVVPKNESDMLIYASYYLQLLKEELQRSRSMLGKLSRSPIILMLKSYVKSLREREIRRMLYEIEQSPIWKPKWVNEMVRLLRHYLMMKDLLKNLKVLISGVKIEPKLMRNFVKFMAYRLYELYTLYILLKALSIMRHCVKIDFEKKRIELIGKKVVIFYTVSPKVDGYLSRLANSTIEVINESRGSITSDCKYCGKPDFSLMRNAKIVILDCKFTNSIPYLSLSKYKIMAYMYEFNSKIGILVFPTISRRHRLIDEREIEADKSLFVMARKHGAVKLNLRDNSKLYIVSVIPLAHWEERNVALIRNILKEVL